MAVSGSDGMREREKQWLMHLMCVLLQMFAGQIRIVKVAVLRSVVFLSIEKKTKKTKKTKKKPTRPPSCPSRWT